MGVSDSVWSLLEELVPHFDISLIWYQAGNTDVIPLYLVNVNLKATAMARLQQAIETITDIFVEYANNDGKLNKEELQKLFEKEIENPDIKAKICAANFNKAMGRLDRNRDGEIQFREFIKCVCFMSKCYYGKKTGKCQEEED